MTNKESDGPFFERLEAIEADIAGVKALIDQLRLELARQQAAVSANERYTAIQRIRLDLNWAMLQLWPIMSDPTKAQAAWQCYQFVRESTVAAITEIRFSGTPIVLAEQWYARCGGYLRERGFQTFG